jgi:hypothetical protein
MVYPIRHVLTDEALSLLFGNRLEESEITEGDAGELSPPG